VKRPGLLRTLVGGGALFAVVWLVCLMMWPVRTVRMEDGSFVTVVGVTHGKNHVAKVGTFPARLTSILSPKLFPKWPRAFSARTNTPTDTLMVWLYATNILAHFDDYGSGFTVDTNGVELETCRVLVNQIGPRGNRLFGLAVDVLPRMEKTFTLRLRNVYHWVQNTKQPHPLGEIVFHNPLRTRARPWSGVPAPQRVTTKEFDCELERCELNLDEPIGNPLSMKWQFYEKGAPVSHWKVQRVEMEDATGNRLSQGWNEGPAAYAQGSSAGWFRRSLFPGAGAWKVRAFVMRTANFRSNEVLEVRDMPAPVQPGHGTKLWRTNFNGELLEVGSYLALGQSRLSPPVGFPQLSAPFEDWMVAICGTDDFQERVFLLALEDDRGRAGKGTAKWTANKVLGWHREWEADAKRCTVRLGISQWRVVEFLVEPTVLNTTQPGLITATEHSAAKPQPNE